MACVTSDGRPTASGQAILQAAATMASAEEIAGALQLPLFRVRSGMRELVAAGLLEERDGTGSAREREAGSERR